MKFTKSIALALSIIVIIEIAAYLYCDDMTFGMVVSVSIPFSLLLIIVGLITFAFETKKKIPHGSKILSRLITACAVIGVLVCACGLFVIYALMTYTHR